MEDQDRKEIVKIASSPEGQPLSVDLKKGRLYSDPNNLDEEFAIRLDAPNEVAKMKKTSDFSRQQWVKDFFGQMSDYVKGAHKKAEIDSETGELLIDPKMPKSGLRDVCNNLAWLYEAQYRQNKEILLWIGEIILDYIARDTMGTMTIETAIEELGLLKRDNGVKWKLRTLVKWPIVVQRLPAPIRQLPIPPSYLTEAAIRSQPEDPQDKVKFNNARDALLVSVAEKPEAWSRQRFVACLKELQDHFGIDRQRNEGTADLQARLIAYYRLQREAENSGDIDSYYENLGLDRKEVATWISTIEISLFTRHKLTIDPKEEVPRGDGLTEKARERLAVVKEGLENKGKEDE